MTFPRSDGRDRSWIPLGACRGVGSRVDFCTGDRGEQARIIDLFCNECKVRSECLEYSLTGPSPEFGIWGGLIQARRYALRRKHAQEVS